MFSKLDEGLGFCFLPKIHFLPGRFAIFHPLLENHNEWHQHIFVQEANIFEMLISESC